MRKLLLATILASSVLCAWAGEKTVIIDLSKPADYGYAEPGNTKSTALKPGDKIESEGVTITNTFTQESTSAVRFYNYNDYITFRLSAEGAQIAITAGGNKILKLDIAGQKIAYGTNFTATPDSTWTNVSNVNTTWTGSADTINIVRTQGNIAISTITVVYECDDEESIAGTRVNKKDNGIIYDILGNQVSAMERGKIYIQNGRKVFVQ